MISHRRTTSPHTSGPCDPRTNPTRGAELRPPAPVPDRQLGLAACLGQGSKDGVQRIKARSETVAEKPSFRSIASKLRAIFPAAGYHEWMKSEEGKKVSYLLHGENDLIVMAGLYELWPDPKLPQDEY